MSEQKTNYMAELNGWADTAVIAPLCVMPEGYDEDEQGDDWENITERVKKAIREKVLESYRNGLKAGAQGARKTSGAR